MTRSAWALLAGVLALAACGGPGAPTAAEAGSETAPDRLTFRADGDASTGTVTVAEGGTVAATASDGTTFELSVPPLAVSEDTEISMTPLADVRGIAAEEVETHAVEMEPEGLVFHEHARLTIVPAEPIPVDRQLMFLAAGDGTGAGSAPVDPTSEAIVIIVEHFTKGGVASVTPEQRRLFREKSAANAEQRLGRQIGANLQDERLQELTGMSDEDLGTTPAKELERIAEEFEREVIAKRRENADGSCQSLKAYVTTVIRWERMRQIAGLSAADEAASQTRIQEAMQYGADRYATCEQEAIKACREQKKPSILVEFWLSFERPADPERAKRICTGQDYRIDKTVTRSELNVTYSITYTGTKCGGHEGTWVIDSAGTLSGYGDTAAIGGPWTVEIPAGSTTGTFQGVAGFVDDDQSSGTTSGRPSGTATFTEDPPTLLLEVTTGGGTGYLYGFTEGSLLSPGPLTLPLEAGSFCEESAP